MLEGTGGSHSALNPCAGFIISGEVHSLILKAFTKIRPILGTRCKIGHARIIEVFFFPRESPFLVLVTEDEGLELMLFGIPS